MTFFGSSTALRRFALPLAGIMIYAMSACGGAAVTIPIERPAPEALAPGLYEVTDRSCDDSQDASSECALIQYVEVTKHHFEGDAHDSMALVLWLASTRDASNYTYEVRPLRGKMVNEREYVVDEADETREWLTTRAGVLREYGFLRFGKQRQQTLVRMVLTLSAAARTPDVDRRLHFVGPGDV